MSIQLTEMVRDNLSWLASNWEAQRLSDISSFNREFYAALLAVLDGSASHADVELIICGTRGKVVDGYAHLLVVETDAKLKDPFVALRILGNISTGLVQIENSC
jgi:hypothetical protein